MKKRNTITGICLFLLLLLCTFQTKAQTFEMSYYQHWMLWPSGGGGMVVVPTLDHSYILWGTARDTINGWNNGHSVYMKVNGSGTILQEKAFSTIRYPYPTQLIQDDDSNFIFLDNPITGLVFSIGLAKADKNMNVFWRKNYGEESGYYTFTPYREIVTGDGGYAVTGNMVNWINGGLPHRAFLLKTDSAGNVQWFRSLTDTGTTLASSITSCGLVQGGKKEYIVYGRMRGDSSFCMAIDSTGNTILWAKEYTNIEPYGAPYILKTLDNGYILTGFYYPSGPLSQYLNVLVKINSMGQIMWEKSYRNYTLGINYEQFLCATLSGDNGVVVGGMVDASPWEGYLYKTDSLGNVLWGKQYNDSMWVQSVVANKTGYLAGAYSAKRPGAPVYLIQTDSMGNSGCSTNLPFVDSVVTNIVAFNIPIKDSAVNPVTTPESTVDTPYSSTPVKICSSCSSFFPAIAGNNIICAGDSTTLTASGGVSYSWSNGATTSSIMVSPMAISTYSVEITAGLCSKDTSITVTVTPIPVVAFSGTDSICSGDSTLITASGGTTYLWSNGKTSSAVSFKPASTATYTLTVSNGTCSTDTAITLTVTSKPVPSISSVQPVCAGSTISLTASGGSSYLWNIGATSATVSVTPPATTTYTVTISNGACSATDSTKVTVIPAPSGSACCSATITSGQTTALNVAPGSAGNTYSWWPASGLSCTTCTSPIASPTVTTWYHVAVTDSEGCAITDSVLITVTENCGAVYVPNAFSPNADGYNDVLYVYGNCIKTMQFRIYDRWGNKVFESSDPKIGWNGTFHGQPMNTGTYVYTLTVLDFSNSTTTKKGNITLVR